MSDTPPICACGDFAIGICLQCRKFVCDSNSCSKRRTDARRYCNECNNLVGREEVAKREHEEHEREQQLISEGRGPEEEFRRWLRKFVRDRPTDFPKPYPLYVHVGDGYAGEVAATGWVAYTSFDESGISASYCGITIDGEVCRVLLGTKKRRLGKSDTVWLLTERLDALSEYDRTRIGFALKNHWMDRRGDRL